MTTKQYLRFSPGNVFGVVGSSTARIIPVRKSDGLKLKDNFFAVPACEDVYVWNLRTKEKAQVFHGEKAFVTCLEVDPNNKNCAVGYADGTVRIFDMRTAACVVSFIGHKSSVSCLTYNDSGSSLVSGGKDSEIVLWNVADEAGVFRLKGHKGPISRCIFSKDKNVLLSSSLDKYVKFWDLDTQHCFHTFVECHLEILDISLIKGKYLFCGLKSGNFRAWDISEKNDLSSIATRKKLKVDETDDLASDAEEEQTGIDGEEKVGTLSHIEIKTEEMKISAIVVDPNERLMGIHGNSKLLYLFVILNPVEIENRLCKRRKRELKRKKSEESGDEFTPTFLRRLDPLPVNGKVDSFSLVVDSKDFAKITVLLKNNSIVQYELNLKAQPVSPEVIRSINIPGHRSFVRTLSCASDGSSILSASDDSLKIWRSFMDEQKCSTTIHCDAAMCCVFVPGNNYCIVGTKNGSCNIYDIDRRCLSNAVNAHDGFVTCMCLTPGEAGITTGGSDKVVKFWDFELVKEDADVNKKLSLIQRRILEMPEEILCVKYSPDGKKIAISLLDSTVQVLFSDTLKLAFSLYGHEFPVTCLDISHDNSLIVTGSNDRTIRIWSMEFGSCNKRIRIADEKGLTKDKGITCIQFLPKSHLFFSGSKDYMVRQWDADNFNKINTLRGHQNEVTAMAVSPDGTYVVTASKDRSIRMWEKTAEPLILEEEQEIEAEEKEREVEDLPAIPGEVNKEVALAGKKTPETIKTVDNMIESLELYKAEKEKLEEYEEQCTVAGKRLPPLTPHPLFMAYRVNTPLEYMRKILRKVKASELDGAMLYLPFNYVLDFLRLLSEFADLGWETEFCEKCVTFLIKIHFGELSATRKTLSIIENLKEKLFKNMYHIRDVVGFAKVVSDLHQRSIEAREEASLFAGILEEKKKMRKRRRKERAVVAFA